MSLTPFVAVPMVGWSLTAVLLLSLPPVWRTARRAERECALALVIACVFDLAFQLAVRSAPAELAHSCANLLTLSLLTRIALATRRSFPLVMAAAQLIAVIAHGLFWSGFIEAKFSYTIILAAMDAATLVALWAGCAHQRQEQTLRSETL